MYRQGEVGIKPISKLPSNLTKKNNILAYGEVTGHKHQLIGACQVFTDGKTQFIEIEETSILQHEEHKPVELPPGTYQVNIQREYDILRDEVRAVTD